MSLDTSPRLVDHDAIFEALVAAHRDLDGAASRELDARLVLLLANHIGDAQVVLEAIALARDAAEPPKPSSAEPPKPPAGDRPSPGSPARHPA